MIPKDQIILTRQAPSTQNTDEDLKRVLAHYRKQYGNNVFIHQVLFSSNHGYYTIIMNVY